MNLSVRNGTFAYKNSENVFSDINFSVSSGDILAIIGANGAGKTTLLKCITGILKWKSGESLVDGKDIRKFSDRELWNIISYVPQNKGIAVTYTVTDMVLLGLSGKEGLFYSPKKSDLEKAENILSQLSISHLKDKRCSELSGGEMQMVLIARALISEPKILILDEPESNLDFRNQYIVLDTVKKLAENKIACIFNTHYPEHALLLANKSLIITGKKGLFGATEDIINEENIEKAFGVKTVITEVETGNGKYEKVIVRRDSEFSETKVRV